MGKLRAIGAIGVGLGSLGDILDQLEQKRQQQTIASLVAASSGDQPAPPQAPPTGVPAAQPTLGQMGAPNGPPAPQGATPPSGGDALPDPMAQPDAPTPPPVAATTAPAAPATAVSQKGKPLSQVYDDAARRAISGKLPQQVVATLLKQADTARTSETAAQQADLKAQQEAMPIFSSRAAQIQALPPAQQASAYQALVQGMSQSPLRDVAGALPKDYTPEALQAIMDLPLTSDQRMVAHQKSLDKRAEALRIGRGIVGTDEDGTPIIDPKFTQTMTESFATQLAGAQGADDYKKTLAHLAADNPDVADKFGKDGTAADIAKARSMALGVKGTSEEADRAATLAERKQHDRAMEARPVGGLSGTGQPAQSTMPDEALNQAADKYYTTGILPSIGIGNAAAADKRAIMARSGERHPGAVLAANSAEYSANKSTLTKLTQQLNAVEAFENTGLKNLKQFTDIAATVPDTGIPWLNSPIRALSSSLVGSENMAAFNAARQVALTEISKVVNNPNLTGTLSDSARQEVLNLSPENATFNQIKRVANVLTTDMQNRHSSLDDQKRDIEGRLGIKRDQPSPETAKTVTEAELGLLAKAHGTTVEQERARATAAGYVIK